MGLFFFLYPENYIYVREVDNLENLIAYLGGITEVLLVGFIGATTVFNQQTIVGKYLKRLYFTPLNEMELKPHVHAQGVDKCPEKLTTFRFTLSDKLSFLKGYLLYFLSYFKSKYEDDEKYLSKGNRLFSYAFSKFGEELNAVTLFQTVQKLKASVEILIQHQIAKEKQNDIDPLPDGNFDSSDLLHKIELAYIHNTTVYDTG